MRSGKLYVGNLNYLVDRRQLSELFGQFGQIDKINIIEGRGYGFVEFKSRADAGKAIKELDGVELMGRNLKVAEAQPPLKPGQPISKLYVGNLSYSVSEDQIRELLEEFGELISISLVNNRGIAFVEFETTDGAVEAMDELNGQEFEGRILRIDFAGANKRDENRDSQDRDRY
jgi:nucleolin